MDAKMSKFMMALDGKWERRLRRLAKKRGIPMQELIRAAIIPEWYSHQPKKMLR